jgi:hypothetical protein
MLKSVNDCQSNNEWTGLPMKQETMDYSEPLKMLNIAFELTWRAVLEAWREAGWAEQE